MGRRKGLLIVLLLCATPASAIVVSPRGRQARASSSGTTLSSKLRSASAAAAAAAVMAGAFLPPTAPAYAAVPTYQEEYGVGSGTMVRSAALPERGEVPAPPQAVASPPTSRSDSKVFFDALRKEVDAAETLVKGEGWDGVLTLAKRPPLKVLRSAKGWPGGAQERREDAAIALELVQDLAMEKRVVFFNSIDLDAINRLKEEGGGGQSTTPQSEVLGLVADLRKAISSLEEEMNAIL